MGSNKHLCFGVERSRSPYRLRQARYWELGNDVAEFAARRYRETGQPIDLLDVGTGNGVARMYIENRPGGEHVRYHAVDIYPKGEAFVYKHEDWTHHHRNLEEGLGPIESNRYDCVICEQVLEHLHHFPVALADLARVLKPGGMLIVGVPIFPDGLHLVRRHVVPMTDKLFRIKKVRSHVQAFSLRSFQNDLRRHCPELEIQTKRGFRIVSGGPLQPLEFCRWWWQLNRKVGAMVPGLCVEIQVIATKPAATASETNAPGDAIRRAA